MLWRGEDSVLSFWPLNWHKEAQKREAAHILCFHFFFVSSRRNRHSIPNNFPLRSFHFRCTKEIHNEKKSIANIRYQYVKKPTHSPVLYPHYYPHTYTHRHTQTKTITRLAFMEAWLDDGVARCLYRCVRGEQCCCCFTTTKLGGGEDGSLPLPNTWRVQNVVKTILCITITVDVYTTNEQQWWWMKNNAIDIIYFHHLFESGHLLTTMRWWSTILIPIIYPGVVSRDDGLLVCDCTDRIVHIACTTVYSVKGGKKA